MKKSGFVIISIFLLCFIGCKIKEEVKEESINENRWFNSPEGLRMRDQPGVSGNILLTVLNSEKVTLLEEKGEILTIQGGTGKWSRILWQENEGWVFGGFLSKEEIIIVDIKNII